MFKNDKKKKTLPLLQNKMRIGITLLYGQDSCIKIFEIYTISLEKQTTYYIFVIHDLLYIPFEDLFDWSTIV